jgi:hypothetical protein
MKLARCFVLLAMFAFVSARCEAASAKIIKTLPHFLDLQGRHTLHPSLFERDAYQDELKRHPDRCSGMRFDIQWKSRDLKKATVRLEVRGAKTPPRKEEVFETEVKAGGLFSRWSALRVEGKDFRRIGEIRAWRVSVWDGGQMLAEEKSFLWD